MKKYFGVVLFLIVTVICFSGCFYDLVIPESDLNSEDTENGSSSPTQEDGVVPEKGTLKIYLTDALEKNGTDDDYDNIFISISRIEAHFVESDEEKSDTEVAGGSIKGNWQVIVEWDEGEGFEVDLIELEGESILLVSSELLPSGKYTQLQVFLESQAIIVVGGGDYDLNIPSVEQTGIKLIHPFEITSGYVTELTLDFDAEKSTIKTGNDEYEYKLIPVIGIISSYSQDELERGSIAGLVYVDIGEIVEEKEGIKGALVKIEGVTLLFEKIATTDDDGYYTISDIPFGEYDTTASAGGYIESFRNIIIDSEEVITVDFELEPEG